MSENNDLFLDHSLPFNLEGKDISGRIVRLGTTVDLIIKAHKYPDKVNVILSQALALATLMGSFMKYEGILTLQIKASGAVQTLVVDYATSSTSDDAILRAYAAFDEEALGQITDDSLEGIFGEGYMMITIDQGQYMERYQGIVALTGQTLAHVAEEYFTSSEQIKTSISVHSQNLNGSWVTGAIMIQHVAKNTEDQQADLKTGNDDAQENWQNAIAMLGSLKADEILDKDLSLQQLLMRLYHETGVRVFDAAKLENGCRCSAQKLRSIISKFSPEELNDIAEEGIIKMTCEFCKTDHKFDIKNLVN